MDKLLTTQEAAALAGVGATAIKRWADQGLLPCVKTAGGHRRFEEGALLAFLRRQASEGDGKDELSELLEVALSAESGYALEALILSWRARLGSWSRVATELGRALEELGERWARGTVSLVEEHVISERLHRAVARVSEGIVLSPRAPLAVLAVVEGDEHVLGLSLLELSLRERGVRSRWVGRALPLDALIELVRGSRPDWVCVSASAASSDAKRLERYAKKLGVACEESGARLLLGGSGAWPDPPPYGARLGGFDELPAAPSA